MRNLHHFVISPAVALMNRLSYSQKICLIGLIFTLPLALSIYIIAAQIQTEKQFAQSEKQGVEYERPLLKFLQHVQQHRGLAGALLNGDESFKDKLLAKQEQIAEDIKAINAMDAKYGAAFKSTVRWQALQEKWGSLKDKISQLNGAQSYEAHTALCAEILLFIKAIANGSNLILDPELDSYYLMDSFIDKLPVLAETLGQGRAYGIGVVTRKKATDEEHARLILLSGIMKSSLHSAQYGLDIATRQNPGITQRIDGALDEKISTATAFLEVLNQRVINRQQIDVSPKDYYDVSTRSIDANFKLSEAVGVALEDVLQARIDGLSKKMIYVFCYVAILIGLAAYLFVGFYFGITGPLKEAIRFTDEIAKGEYDKPIVISAHDEMATLGKAINQMSESISANAERERIQREREREASQELKQNVERILETVSNAAQGDLTGRLDVKGDQTIEELAFGLQCMIDNLCSLVGRVQQSGIQVASSSTQIMASAKEQEATVNEQAASAVEILATTKEISATSRQLVKTMDEVSQVAEQTSELAAEGKQGLDRLDQTMREMVNASTSIVSKLAVLSEKANNINSVVTTISKVADQTNLLSLNAAIEAEKAGEYGHGFSVVATEIRRLADQTAVATWDIEQMLKEMQSAVSAGVMGMDKFSEEIRRIVSEVGQVSGQLAKVVDQVQTLTPSFDQVLQGTQAQALGAEQITEAMSQLKETVQQTADSLRNSNDAIDQLNEAARSLQTGVSQFRVAG